MRDLSLHILDLAQNSIQAGASLITFSLSADTARDELAIAIEDDGCGMDPAFLARVTDPFTTSRTTRQVGLGIPMFQRNAQQCGGTFDIDSAVGQGTRLRATFRLSHIDRPPMGDISGTLLTLILAQPEKPDFVVRADCDGEHFSFDTREVREALGGIPLDVPDVIAWIRENLAEGLARMEAF